MTTTNTNTATKTKTFKEVNQWVIALLVASLVGVLVLALALFPTLGWAKILPLVATTIGIFVTAIALHVENQRVVGVLALAGILLAAYAHLDGLRASSEAANCPVEVSQTK